MFFAYTQNYSIHFSAGFVKHFISLIIDPATSCLPFSFEIQTSLLIPLNMISMDLFHEYFICSNRKRRCDRTSYFCCCCSCCCCLRFLTHVLSYIAKLNLNWHRKAAEVVIFGSQRNASLS